MDRHVLSGIMALSLLVGCGPPGDGAVACGSLEPRNEDEVALCNGLEQAVVARVALPEGEPPAAGWPGVVVLHGSSGLFDEAKGGDCSETTLEQFRVWEEELPRLGYAAIFPASFYSRGFCDYTKGLTVPREYDRDERLVTRVYDAEAAGAWLCEDPRIDCERIAVMGFSNGGTVTLMSMQDDLSVARDPRLQDLDGALPFVGGVAYYPGCGLRDQLSSKLDQAEIAEFFFPRGPVWVPHAEKDSLAETCEGLRDPQVDIVADVRGINEDMFELEIYANAKHGFDNSFSGDREADLAAKAAAEAETLSRLESWLK